jgi:hypothetical protein
MMEKSNCLFPHISRRNVDFFVFAAPSVTGGSAEINASGQNRRNSARKYFKIFLSSAKDMGNIDS